MDDFEVTEADKRIWERAAVEAGYAPLRNYVEKCSVKTNELNQGALEAALKDCPLNDRYPRIQAIRAYLASIEALLGGTL